MAAFETAELDLNPTQEQLDENLKSLSENPPTGDLVIAGRIGQEVFHALIAPETDDERTHDRIFKDTEHGYDLYTRTTPVAKLEDEKVNYYPLRQLGSLSVVGNGIQVNPIFGNLSIGMNSDKALDLNKTRQTSSPSKSYDLGLPKEDGTPRITSVIDGRDIYAPSPAGKHYRTEFCISVISGQGENISRVNYKAPFKKLLENIGYIAVISGHEVELKPIKLGPDYDDALDLVRQRADKKSHNLPPFVSNSLPMPAHGVRVEPLFVPPETDI